MAKKAIERTAETGNEHAFVVCDDGSTSEIKQGGKKGMKISDLTAVCAPDDDSGMVVFHTHPNGVKRLSGPDKQVLGRDDVDGMCVGDTEGEFMCRTSGQCRGSVNVDA